MTASGRTGAPDATGWTLVVPVKSLTGAKTRLAPELGPGERAALARAFALDTIDAARAARAVRRVVVVTDEPVVERELRGVPGVDVVPESGPRGLAAAIAYGIAVARADAPSTAPSAASAPAPASASAIETSQMQGADRHSGRLDAEALGGARSPAAAGAAVAVLLGDLPAMRSGDLDAALEDAARHPLAFVADAEGSGTTLATALAEVPFVAHFGPDSAARHRAAGFADLIAECPGSIAPGLRRDVDTAAELDEAAALGVGTRTSEVLRSLPYGVDGPAPRTSATGARRPDLAHGAAPRHPLPPSTAPTGAANAPDGADRKAAS
ncbi:hypothetical protein [Agromyces sp. GXS1127]|uniref:hypothetical protein n=1 Tax=Agromyces sp. GXS1127 TaxID=3424181 RepID=UPI003D31E8C5